MKMQVTVIFLLFFMGLTSSSFGQIIIAPPTNIVTPPPCSDEELYPWRLSNSSTTNISLCRGYENIGIGTGNPLAKLDLLGDFRVTGNSSMDGNLNLSGEASINTATINTLKVATNCIPSGFKLAVGGKIICEELEVKLKGANCWADYVFGENYVLKPLSEVEQYINKNKHLPGIPSAQELAEEGVSVKEMLKLQMEKIEELTLYILEQDKRIKELEAKK